MHSWYLKFSENFLFKEDNPTYISNSCLLVAYGHIYACRIWTFTSDIINHGRYSVVSIGPGHRYVNHICKPTAFQKSRLRLRQISDGIEGRNNGWTAASSKCTIGQRGFVRFSDDLHTRRGKQKSNGLLDAFAIIFAGTGGYYAVGCVINDESQEPKLIIGFSNKIENDKRKVYRGFMETVSGSSDCSWLQQQDTPKDPTTREPVGIALLVCPNLLCLNLQTGSNSLILYGLFLFLTNM